LPEQASPAGPVGHHEQLADTRLDDDPRGGYRFHAPADQAFFGADADQRHVLEPERDEKATEEKEQDARRLAFPGDAQHPPQSYPRGGTQATWDDRVLPEPEPYPEARTPARDPHAVDEGPA
jgi:hypothetical protein